MEYVVKHYFPVKGGLLTPGEIVRDLPEEIIPRLLEKGAIEEIAPAPSAAKSVKPVKPAKAPKAKEAEEAEEIDEEYGDAEGEALEIDPMDAVVAAEEAPKKTTRKKSAKKEG